MSARKPAGPGSAPGSQSKIRRSVSYRKRHLIREAAATLRDLRSFRKEHSNKPFPELVPAQVVGEMGDGAPGNALSHIRARLEFARSVAKHCISILKAQAADLDLDVAATLRCCVGDELSDQIEQIDRLLAAASRSRA